jgi:hypothetical protein
MKDSFFTRGGDYMKDFTSRSLPAFFCGARKKATITTTPFFSTVPTSKKKQTSKSARNIIKSPW